MSEVENGCKYKLFCGTRTSGSFRCIKCFEFYASQFQDKQKVKFCVLPSLTIPSTWAYKTVVVLRHLLSVTNSVSCKASNSSQLEDHTRPKVNQSGDCR